MSQQRKHLSARTSQRPTVASAGVRAFHLASNELKDRNLNAPAQRSSVPPKNIEEDALDDVERMFLEPVARYLAVLREWSMERRCDGVGTDSSPEKP